MINKINFFKENDIIRIVSKVDDNWFEGQINNRSGYFPQSYVRIIITLKSKYL